MTSPSDMSGLSEANRDQKPGRALRTHCKNGHPFSGDNLFIRSNGERQCIACRRASAIRSQKYGLPSKRAVTKLMEGLRAGLALQTLTKGYGPGGYQHSSERVISGSRLANLRRLSPAIDKKIRLLIEKNGPIYNRRISDARRVVAAPALLRNNGADAFAIIMKSTEGVWEGIRDDIRGALFVAVAEGRIALQEIPSRVREFVALHNRQNRFSVMNPWGNLSLDAPVNGEDGASARINFISEDRRLWA